MKRKALKVSRKQQNRRRDEQEATTVSDEEEPQAKRMEGDMSALAEHHEKVETSCTLSCVAVFFFGI